MPSLPRCAEQGSFLLAETPSLQEEIQKMISDVDDDGSGTIGYEELLGGRQQVAVTYCTSVDGLGIHIHIRKFIYICIYQPVHLHITCIYIYIMYIYIHPCIYIYMYVYIYIYMVPPRNPTSFHDALSLLPSMDTCIFCVYTYTHTYIYTYMYICICCPSFHEPHVWLM